MNQEIPEKPKDGNWLGWVNKHYPFAPEWESHLQTRMAQPVSASAEQLNDLRGIRVRETAVHLAKLWFHLVENCKSIAREKAQSEAHEFERERRRLIALARQALDGKLGASRDERDAAQATAQEYCRRNGKNVPVEQMTDDELRDWSAMHQYARALTNGKRPARPVLSADRRTLEDVQMRLEV